MSESIPLNETGELRSLNDRLALVGVLQEFTVATLRLFDPAHSVDDFLHAVAARMGCRVVLCIEARGLKLDLRGSAGLSRHSESLPLPRVQGSFCAEDLRVPYPELAEAELARWIIPCEIEQGEGKRARLWLYLFFEREPRLSRQYRGMLARVGHQLAVAFQHRRLHERLRERQLRLRVESSRLRALVDHMPSGLLSHDEDGRITHVNNTFCGMFGFRGSPRELMGSSDDVALEAVKELLPDSESFDARKEEILSAGRVVLDEELTLVDGRVMDLDYIPIRLEGRSLGGLWNFRDVTRAHRAAEEIRQLNESLERRVAERTGELRASNRELTQSLEKLRSTQDQLVQAEKLAAVGQLAAGFAHEINNPLGVILGFSQGLKRRVPSESPLTMPISSIHREAVRCKDLVQNLLTFSRQAGREKEPVDLNELARLAFSLLASRARMQKVRLLESYAQPLPKVRGNGLQMEQVLVNIGNNALDAMPDGGELSVRTCLEDGWIRMEVTDSGSGISEEILPRVFDPFFTTKEVGKGTGLGLCLSYEIVQQHGGWMVIESSPMKGTRVIIALPTSGSTPAPGHPASHEARGARHRTE